MNSEKYLQIFNYLHEFSRLRSRAVRDIETSNNYLDILWISDIPEDDKIDCIVQEGFSDESSYWLKISKPVEPEKPIFNLPPKNIQSWIIPESLLHKDDLPELFDEISTENDEILRLINYPEIETEFNEYCENKWLHDSNTYWSEMQTYDVEYEKYTKVNSVFKKLFSIYNKSEQFIEEYELILGVGLLNFKESDETPLICSHIVIAKAEIQFEFSKRDSSLIVSQSLEDGLQIETDAIIDLEEQFDSNDIVESEKIAKEIIREKELINPFDEDIHDVLQLLAERIKPGDGVYKDKKFKTKEIPKKETVFFAPALILRKRDTRSYTSMYEKIIKNIKESGDTCIPTLDDLIETDKPESFYTDSTNNIELIDSDPIYFPLKFNDEQKAIINKARFNNKVLVQGPPGTGKSHTIANLICHFLANGKKILVTAYTKRALEVLKDKMPSEFKHLTVNLLSGDASSIQDLEASVRTINDELSNTNIETLKDEINELDLDFTKLKGKRAYDTNELLKIKEKSSRKTEINPSYHGNLTEIAIKIEKDKIKYDWYKDNFVDYTNTEAIDQIKSFVVSFQHYSNYDTSHFKYDLPDKSRLFEQGSLEAFKNLSIKAKKNNLSKYTGEIIDCKDFPLLKDYLKVLKTKFENIKINQHPRKYELIDDVINHNKRIWDTKIERSKPILSEFKNYDLRFIDRNVEIIYQNDKSLINLKHDAKVLLSFLNEGNSLSGISYKLKKAFFPKKIKKKLYFIDTILVNGSLCDSTDKIGTVLQDINTKQNFDELSAIWENKNEKSFSSFEKFIYYQQLYDETLKIFEHIYAAQVYIKKIKTISNISIESFKIDELNQANENTKNTIILNDLKAFENKREQTLKYLSADNFHPIAKDISNALTDLNVVQYQLCCQYLEKLQQDFEEFKRYNELKNLLNQKLPNLLDIIQKNRFTINDIHELEEAIIFKHASNEIVKLLSADFEKELKEKLKSYDAKEESLIAKIASKKSWIIVLENLKRNRNLRQHLEAWVQAVKKIGKTGRGKRALKFRKIAQEEMEYCKTSVPCWIMPLYKVIETLKPEKGIYDYVIIDEASQLGPDAIFLLYISKNIIIVGDDKQTSPEYIGVTANAMTPYINKHLQGIPFKNFYGTEYSFFDHAKRFCEGITVLREHFRCMPEIIEFSNKLFYAPDGKGLYPLKQYSEKRLNPLMHVYCQRGFVEGQGSNIRNEQEAQEITDKILELVNDNKYSGKSIGVICLQGNTQSALIETLLVKNIGEKEFKKRKIICGNSASFQGDERDIIFLSLVTASNHNRSALTRPEDERRFNVAVSRAIEQIWLFHSILPEDLSNTNDLRYKLLDHFLNHKPTKLPAAEPIERTLGNQPEPFESWFEVDVFNDVVNQGYNVQPQYEVAKGKYRIDLVAFFPDGTKIAIECDGDKWHGADKYKDDMMRQKVLERCGWQFFRIRGGEYYSNREKALAPLWEIFKKHEISRNEKSNSPKKTNFIETSNEIEKNQPIDSETSGDVGKTIEISDLSNQAKKVCKYNKLDTWEKITDYYKEHGTFLDLFYCGESANNELINFCKIFAPHNLKSDSFKYLVINNNLKEEFDSSFQFLRPRSKNVLKEKPKEDSDNFNKVLIKKIEDIEIIKYSPKSIAVFGFTKEIKDDLKLLGGRYNPFLKRNDKRCYGWIFQKNKLDEVITLIKQWKNKSQ